MRVFRCSYIIAQKNDFIKISYILLAIIKNHCYTISMPESTKAKHRRPSINSVLNKIRFVEDRQTCEYYSDRETLHILSSMNWLEGKDDIEKLDCIVYGHYLREGFRRYTSFMYHTLCEGCHECIPIRLVPDWYVPSKSQMRVFKKNQDIDVTVVSDPKEFCTPEKIRMFRTYYNRHNENKPGYKKLTLAEAEQDLKDMNSGYSGIFNFDFKLGDRLIGVSIIDYTLDKKGRVSGLSSNYFYYDTSPEILKRSIGVFSVMYEIIFCMENNIPYYYLGLYLPYCHKMSYKANYKPYQLLINNVWTDSRALELCPQVLENFLRIDKEDSEQPKIDTSDVFTFPKPGLLYGAPDISLVTDNIPLRLLYSAYNQGVFPWFDEASGDPVIWQSPKKRFVIPIRQLHVSKSIEKFLKHNPYTYTIDKAFERVIKNCAKQKRPEQDGTWIGPKMIEAYIKFHKAGYAHSIEVWHGKKLVGGFYGVLVGSVFCGESMFTIEPNSSKSAFVLFARAFQKAGGKLIDCQAYTPNMERYGARNISRKQYLEKLQKYSQVPLKCGVGEMEF